jgi:hypothetical protein
MRGGMDGTWQTWGDDDVDCNTLGEREPTGHIVYHIVDDNVHALLGILEVGNFSNGECFRHGGSVERLLLGT